MKTFLFFLLTSASIFGQAFSFNDISWMSPKSVSVSAGPTYLVQEDFEGSGYQLTWTENGSGTLNEDYTTNVFNGTHALYINMAGNNGRTTNVFGTALATNYVYFALRMVSIPGATRRLCAIQSSGSTHSILQIDTSGRLIIQSIGGTAQTTVGALSVGTWYHVWMESRKGTGANGYANVAFSTDGTRPTSGDNYDESADGTMTSDIDRCYFGVNASSTVEYIVDKFRVDDVVIGNSPP